MLLHLLQRLLDALLQPIQILHRHRLHQLGVQKRVLLRQSAHRVLELQDLVDGVEGGVVVVAVLFLPEVLVLLLEVVVLYVLVVRLVTVELLFVLVLLEDPVLCVLLDQDDGGPEYLGHLLHDLLRLFGQQEEVVETQDDPGALVLHAVADVVADQLVEHGGEESVAVGQGESGGGGQPQQHADKLAGQSLHHLALELGNVDFGELVDMVVDVFGQPPLVVLEQVDEEGSAAGDVEFAVEIVGRVLVHLADQVEQQLDDAGLEDLLVGLRIH